MEADWVGYPGAVKKKPLTGMGVALPLKQGPERWDRDMERAVAGPLADDIYDICPLGQVEDYTNKTSNTSIV